MCVNKYIYSLAVLKPQARYETVFSPCPHLIFTSSPFPTVPGRYWSGFYSYCLALSEMSCEWTQTAYNLLVLAFAVILLSSIHILSCFSSQFPECLLKNL